MCKLRIALCIVLACTLLTWLFVPALPGLVIVAVGLTGLTFLLMILALLIPESWFERSNLGCPTNCADTL